MKYAQVRLQFRDEPMTPVQAALVESGAFRRATLRFGGVATTGPRTYVFSVTGDPAAVGEALATQEGVHDHELVDKQDDYALVYVRADATEIELTLQSTFTQASLVTPPPIDFDPDGSVVIRVLGDPEDLSTAVDQVRDRLTATVERVADYERHFDTAVAALTERQREAIRAALDVGYYDTPRTATHEDVAAALDCAPATVSEHLQKAESALVRALFA